MSAYVRELFLDFVADKLDPIDDLECIDIELGIKHLYGTGQIGVQHIAVALGYMMGYSLPELRLKEPLAEQLLLQFFSLLEQQTGYLDEYVVQYAVRLFPKYQKTRAAFLQKMLAYGNNF